MPVLLEDSLGTGPISGGTSKQLPLADLAYSFMAGGKLLLSFRSCLTWSVGVGFVYVGWMGMEGAVFAAGDGV